MSLVTGVSNYGKTEACPARLASSFCGTSWKMTRLMTTVARSSGVITLLLFPEKKASIRQQGQQAVDRHLIQPAPTELRRQSAIPTERVLGKYKRALHQCRWRHVTVPVGPAFTFI